MCAAGNNPTTFRWNTGPIRAGTQHKRKQRRIARLSRGAVDAVAHPRTNVTGRTRNPGTHLGGGTPGVSPASTSSGASGMNCTFIRDAAKTGSPSLQEHVAPTFGYGDSPRALARFMEDYYHAACRAHQFLQIAARIADQPARRRPRADFLRNRNFSSTSSSCV